MKLKVVATQTQPWYADGLNFTCSQCGNCCTGGPGFVWVSKEEIVRLAEHLNLTPAQIVERYCRKIDGRFSLTEKRRGENYDCIFLEEEQVRERPAGSDREVLVTRRRCSVYEVRPLQCRTWPFWPGDLSSPQRWAHSAQRCHGMNHGSRKFSLEQIHAIRDAADWPANPPTSAPRVEEKMEDRR